MRVRKFLMSVVLAIGAAGAPAFGHATSINIDVSIPPPAQPVVVVPPPRRGYVYAPGYWHWDGHRHAWTEGRWLRERHGYAWVPERWEPRGHHWRFVPGHWERAYPRHHHHPHEYRD